jgi:hypothetical protein
VNGREVIMVFLQTVANHLGRPIDTFCHLIENILDVPTRKMGDLLGDCISYWQWSNRISISEKVKNKLEERNISTRFLPLEFAIPFLRECGDAGNDNLQEWWAEMLASAIADDACCHIAYVNTLRSMSPSDVRFLDAMIVIGPLGVKERIQVIAEKTGLSIMQANASFHNLEALGFFTPTARRLKGFAFDFLRACSPNKESITAYLNSQKQLPHALIED